MFYGFHQIHCEVITCINFIYILTSVGGQSDLKPLHEGSFYDVGQGRDNGKKLEVLVPLPYFLKVLQVRGFSSAL